jgi:hypothetical protein
MSPARIPLSASSRSPNSVPRVDEFYLAILRQRVPHFFTRGPADYSSPLRKRLYREYSSIPDRIRALREFATIDALHK